MKTWLWTNRTISKTESAQLREEHNAAVNTAHELLTALREVLDLPQLIGGNQVSITIRNARTAIYNATK